MSGVYITKVANGYMIQPPVSYHRGDCAPPDKEVYVFNDYNKLVDKLRELLDDPRTPEQRREFNS